MAINGVDHHLRVGGKSDPLGDVPDGGQVLFRELSARCSQFPTKDVINACAALLLNAIRQRSKLRAEAEGDFNELYGRMKSLLLMHYDSVSGKRRGVFPFRQIIEMPLMNLRDKKN